MRSIPPSSSATRATTATAFATTWRSEASNPSSRRDRTVRRQSKTIGKPTSGATSSSDASIASSNSGASPPDTRKPRELTFRCYASQQRNSGSKPSTRPSLVHGVSLSLRGSGRLDTRLDTPPISFRHHPVPRIAQARGGSRSACPLSLRECWRQRRAPRARACGRDCAAAAPPCPRRQAPKLVSTPCAPRHAATWAGARSRCGPCESDSAGSAYAVQPDLSALIATHPRPPHRDLAAVKADLSRRRAPALARALHAAAVALSRQPLRVLAQDLLDRFNAGAKTEALE